MHKYEHLSFKKDNQRFSLRKISKKEKKIEISFNINETSILPGMLIWIKDSIYGKTYKEDNTPLADKSFGISEETRALVLVLENINIPDANNSKFSYSFHEDFPGFLVLFNNEIFYVRLEDITGILKINNI
jgi:hypothetical protein